MAFDRMWLTYRPTGERVLLATSPGGGRWEPRGFLHTGMTGTTLLLDEALAALFEHVLAPGAADFDPKGFVVEYESDGPRPPPAVSGPAAC